MKQILFVDDNLPLRKIFARVLRDRAHQVQEVKDGDAALQLIRDKDFDVVITDLLLPGAINGVAVLAYHNRLSPDKQRILFTAFNSHQLPIICRYIRARYVMKPASMGELIDIIEGHS